jgi:multiple sugar transport system substrate-binding protein/sn-glycerol 3-phosphate transport system substrate-binding protein
MSRCLWSLFLIGLLVSLATGCRAIPLPALAAGDDLDRLDPSGEVILWHSLSGPAAETLAQLTDEFNASNSWRIVVVPQYQGVYSTLRARLDDALERGASPDLATLYSYHAADYVRRGAAVTLDPYINNGRFGLNEADRGDIFPVLLNSDRNPQMGGQLVSFPMERSALVLYYNADWLKLLGYQAPPLTWPAFKEMCQRASTDTNGDGQPDTYGYAMVPNAETFSVLVLSRGGTLVSEDARLSRFNSTEGTRAMNILRDIFPFRQAYVAQGQGWDRLDFAKGQALFTIAPSSELPAYKAAVVDQAGLFRWSIAPLPHNTPDPISLFVGQSWTVLKTTPRRQMAAWLFIRWMGGVNQTRRWAEATTTLPLRNSAAQAMLKKDIDPNIKLALDLLPFGQSEPAVPGWDAARHVLAETMRAVAGGQAPPAALEQAEAKINPLLK